jgi:hypothetical protein
MNNTAFIHHSFWGELFSHAQDKVFGFENQSEHNKNNQRANVSAIGGCFGYVHSGKVTLHLDDGALEVRKGWWFATQSGMNATLSDNCRMVAIQHIGYVGIDAVGVVEQDGRLGYIDGCTNSILVGPHKQGEPVLNGLFMPTGINQTMHTHPSLRAGIIISGEATCNTPKRIEFGVDYSLLKESDYNVLDLVPGVIFILKPECWHKFRTDITMGNLRLIAYHPDSDFGPTDEESPMLNRTMVGDESHKEAIKNRREHLTVNMQSK